MLMGWQMVQCLVRNMEKHWVPHLGKQCLCHWVLHFGEAKGLFVGMEVRLALGPVLGEDNRDIGEDFMGCQAKGTFDVKPWIYMILSHEFM
jgi:hypothetical protein